MATKKTNTKASSKTAEKKTNQTAENTQTAEAPANKYKEPFETTEKGAISAISQKQNSGKISVQN